MKIKWREVGFTQRKPKEPGVYFVRTDGHLPMAPKERMREHWDIADVHFYAGDYFNPSNNREGACVWRIHTLDGLSYTWRPGMWLKGPIHPVEIEEQNDRPVSHPLQNHVPRRGDS